MKKGPRGCVIDATTNRDRQPRCRIKELMDNEETSEEGEQDHRHTNHQSKHLLRYLLTLSLF